MLNLKNNSLSNASEKGSVLPFIAVCLILIMALLALVFDFGAMTATKSDLRDTTRASALAALKTYIEDLNTRTDNNAGVVDEDIANLSFSAAVDAAKEITGLNLQASLSSGLRYGDNDAHKDIGSVDANRPSGTVQVGRWHFIESPEGGSPCTPENEDFIPCFEPIADNQIGNAMRVALTDEGSRTRGIFRSAGRISGNYNIEDRGTAAFVPRQGVVSFDLSTSATRTSHLPTDIANEGKRSEYAFYLDPDEFGGPVSCNMNWPDAMSDSLRTIWNAMDQERDPNNVNQQEKDHFKEDYKCLVINVTDPEGGDYNEHFVVENQIEGQPTILGAEPLDSILLATNFLLNEFSNRRVAGDRVGAFGFDTEEIIPERRLPEQPIGDILLAQPVATETDFQSFLNATRVNDFPIEDPRRNSRFLFPRILTGSPAEQDRKTATTNLQLALQTSLTMLRSSTTFEISDNFILLITDGITNCVQNDANSPVQNAGEGGNEVINCFSNQGANWPLTRRFIEAGFEEILGNNNNITQSLIDDGVRLHVALVGDHVGPHTLVRKSESGQGCMSVDEASSLGLNLVNSVNPQADFNPSSGEPYFFPNEFSSVATATGGRWRPIVRPCQTAGLTLDALEQACNDFANDGQNSVIMPDDSGIPNISSSDWDAQGRLLCNPGGASVQEQLENLVEEIMSDSPIIIVE